MNTTSIKKGMSENKIISLISEKYFDKVTNQ
jgi:hypothetical protein